MLKTPTPVFVWPSPGVNRNDHFATIGYTGEYPNIRRELASFQRHYSEAVAKLPIGPNIYCTSSALCMEVLPEYASQLVRSLSRIDNLAMAFGISAVKSGSEVLYEISEDRQGTKSIAIFPALELFGNRYYTFATSKYLTDLSFRNLQHVRLRTGSCLFSNQAARYVEHDEHLGSSVVLPMDKLPDNPVCDIRIDDNLTLYEFETALRLGTMIGDVINSLPQATSSQIILDVPRVQYYLYPLDLYVQGRISSALMMKWFAAVDRRSERVKKLLRERISNRVAVERRIIFSEATMLDGLEPYLRREIEHNSKTITVEACISVLRQTANPILDLILDRKRTRSFRDLSHASYIAQMLDTGLNNNSNEMGIDIENHIERRVFSYVDDFASKIRKMHPQKSFALLGLYPRERLFTTDDTWRPSLYRFDPGRYAFDATNNKVDLFVVAEQFYR